MLGITIAITIKVTTKLSSCLYVNKMVLIATMAEYKLGVAHNALNTIMVTSTIGLAIKPSQSMVATQSMEL